MARHVLLLTNEMATTEAVSAALQSNGRLAPDDVCRDFGALAARLQTAPASVVLVDIAADPKGILSRLDGVVRRFPDTRFVVLAESVRSDLLLEAMDVGARHFMTKQAIPTDLMGVLNRLAPSGGAGEEEGLVVTVLSAGGGAGATTLAVNLANELQLLNASPALIIDMDGCYGGAASYLGLDAPYGMLDILNRGGTIDDQLLRTTVTSFSEHLMLLPSASSLQLGEAWQPEPERLRALVEASQHAFAYTVIDAPRVPLALAAELASLSDMTFVLFQLSVKDVRIVRMILAKLAGSGIAPEFLTPLVNRYRKRGHLITLEKAQEAIGSYPLQTLSNDFEAASGAMNLGKPLAQAAPRSALRTDVQRLATKLAEAQTKRASGQASR